MKSTPKLKTSVSLSQATVKAIDRLAGARGNRSDVIERAVHALAEAQRKLEQDERDRRILDDHAERLNAEADDVLKYQVSL